MTETKNAISAAPSGHAPEPKTNDDKAELLREMARASYQLRRDSAGPYIVLSGAQTCRFTDRRLIRAALRAAWREKFPSERCPPDSVLDRLVDDLEYGAGQAEQDPLTPQEQAARLVDEAGIEGDADGCDMDSIAARYPVRNGVLGWLRPLGVGGEQWTALATFDAQITEEVVRDDGAEATLHWQILVTTPEGRTGTTLITPDQLGRPQQWAPRAVGYGALVMPGQMIAEHLRTAVHSRSRSIVSRTVYAHTGWRKTGARWGYLTASGAVTSDGLDESVSVDLGTLSGYALPDETSETALRSAVRSSLAVLSAVPDSLGFPLLGAVYRAPLPVPADCAVWVWGRSGSYKTALTALAQQHYGSSMDAQHLPGNWTSTGNMLETQAFLLDSALFVVDDYSPDSTKADAQRRAQAADRLIRGSANHAGRGRLRPDGTARTARPPRAQVLTSAEDVPPGVESLRARTLICEVSPGMVLLPQLGDAQAAATAGELAVALAGYIMWLARRYDADSSLPSGLASARDHWRGQIGASGHPRHALNVASLALGWHEFLAYAAAIGAVSDAERDAYWQRAWNALCAVGADQDRYRQDADPVSVYFTSLNALISSRRAHLADHDGSRPDNADRWGWEPTGVRGDGTQDWRPGGDLIGWLHGDDVYLEPAAAFRAVRMFAEQAGQVLGQSPQAVYKLMRDGGFLASSGTGRNTVRRDVGGQRSKHVVHLTSRRFENASGEEDPS